jgi:hypothetical protein
MQQLDFITEDRKQCPACYSETMIITHVMPAVSEPGTMFVKWECKARIKGVLCNGKKFERLPMVVQDLSLVHLPKSTIVAGHATDLGDCPRCGDKRQALQNWGEAGQICLRCTAELTQLGYDPKKAPLKHNTRPVLQCELCQAMVKLLHLVAGGMVCDACKEVCDEGTEALRGIVG